MSNVFDKHRMHHNVKTTGIWTSRVLPDTDRDLEWTTLTGRTYTTRPKNWRDGLDTAAKHPPPDDVPPEPDPPPF